ncbi:hypothetical protein BBO_08801 [Beauveria brongniartii RCEF 3172]|uniref:Uncharacterized protein n=1 Tax=Beauveria brongniartii RCEF 3172 TaxID=1081107 RepID=A0A166X3C3_9HYPO|nr:hypothetical protein BBO_08801 [Beauveria brongniartii RCEF 3172]
MPRRVPKRRDTLAPWLRLWTQQDRDALGLDPRNLSVNIRHPDRQLAAVSRVRPGHEPFLPTSLPAALTRSRFGITLLKRTEHESASSKSTAAPKTRVQLSLWAARSSVKWEMAATVREASRIQCWHGLYKDGIIWYAVGLRLGK